MGTLSEKNKSNINFLQNYKLTIKLIVVTSHLKFVLFAASFLGLSVLKRDLQ